LGTISPAGQVTVWRRIVQPATMLEEALVGVRPSGSSSVTAAPIELEGPLFFTFSVKLTVPPGATVSRSAVLVISRSATGPATSGVASLLFSVIGSGVSLERTATVEVFEVSTTLLSASTVIVRTAVSPLASVPIAQVTC